MSQIFTVIGDSNIRNHVNKNSIRANPSLKDAQVLSCGNFSIFPATLEKVRPKSTVVIVACVSNFLSDAQGPPTVSLRVDPVLQDFRAALHEVCSAHPDRYYLVSPPMYRTTPIWYREGLPEILNLFSQVLNPDKPPNLHLLSTFATPEFEADGVHLTPYSGLEFILHLFDGSSELLSRLATPAEELVVKGSESTRVLEDRVMVLEQDHRRLNRVFEDKTAHDAEMADFHSNERSEDFFVISGLPRISDDLVGKAWQDEAVREVSGVIVKLMGRAMPIVYIKNSTPRYPKAEVTYSVQMTSVSDSRAIRKKFGSFFLTGTNKCPKDLKSISISNFVTPETRIRISILKLLARKYRDANKGAKVKVIGYQPRPVIKITPPASASDRRILNYNYVEAVKKLPCSFSSAEIDPIIGRINPNLLGKIRSIFIVISDDQFKKKVSRARGPRNAATGAPEGSDDESASEMSVVENMSVSSAASVPAVPAVAPASAPVVLPASSRSQSSRGSKRGASPQGGSAAKK